MQATKLLTLSSFKTLYLESTIQYNVQPNKAIIQALREEEDNPQDFIQLRLAHQGLEDDDIIPLLEALKKNSTVQELDLSHNKILNASIFSDLLLENKTLRTINLSHNPLSSQTISPLLTNALSEHSLLDVLDLSNKEVYSCANASRKRYSLQKENGVKALESQQSMSEYSFSDSPDSVGSSITTMGSLGLIGEPTSAQEDRLSIENSEKENQLLDALKFSLSRKLSTPNVYNPFFSNTESSLQICDSPSFPVSQSLSASLQDDEALLPDQSFRDSIKNNQLKDITSRNRGACVSARGNNVSIVNLKELQDISQRLESYRNHQNSTPKIIDISHKIHQRRRSDRDGGTVNLVEPKPFKETFVQRRNRLKSEGQLLFLDSQCQVSERNQERTERISSTSINKTQDLQNKRKTEAGFLELMTKINTFFNENIKLMQDSDFEFVEQINKYQLIFGNQQEKEFGLIFENLSSAHLREDGIFPLLRGLLSQSVQVIRINSSLLSQNSLCQFIGENLKVLNLSDNNLQELKCLVKCRNLEFINLSHNQLTNVKGFIMCPNLREIILKYNKIDSIKSLVKCSNLRLLDLSFNNIQTHESIMTLNCNDNLEVLHLEGNPLTSQKGYETEIRVNLHRLKVLNPFAIEEYSYYKRLPKFAWR